MSTGGRTGQIAVLVLSTVLLLVTNTTGPTILLALEGDNGELLEIRIDFYLLVVPSPKFWHHANQLLLYIILPTCPRKVRKIDGKLHYL